MSTTPARPVHSGHRRGERRAVPTTSSAIPEVSTQETRSEVAWSRSHPSSACRVSPKSSACWRDRNAKGSVASSPTTSSASVPSSRRTHHGPGRNLTTRAPVRGQPERETHDQRDRETRPAQVALERRVGLPAPDLLGAEDVARCHRHHVTTRHPRPGHEQQAQDDQDQGTGPHQGQAEPAVGEHRDGGEVTAGSDGELRGHSFSVPRAPGRRCRPASGPRTGVASCRARPGRTARFRLPR